MNPMKRSTIEVAGGSVSVADFGGEGEPMLLVHGLGGSHLNWAAVGPALAKRFRVWAIDLIGFGYTAPAGRRATVHANASLVQRFIEEHLGAPAHLVGNSMGGMICLSVAAEHPRSVRSLVLASPAVPRDLFAAIDPRVAAMFGLAMIPGVGEYLLRLDRARKTPDQYVEEMIALTCKDPGAVPRDVLELHYAFARTRDERPWSLPAYLEAARSVVARLLRRGVHDAELKKISAPALVFGGAHDVLVPIAAIDRLAKLRPDWKYLRVAHLGHVPMLEAPGFFVDEIFTWFDERQARSSGAAA